MAIQSHPLSNAALGEFIDSETINLEPDSKIAKFSTVFNYEKGCVVLNNKWQWETVIYDEGEGPENNITLSQWEKEAIQEAMFNQEILETEPSGAFTI